MPAIRTYEVTITQKVRVTLASDNPTVEVITRAVDAMKADPGDRKDLVEITECRVGVVS